MKNIVFIRHGSAEDGRDDFNRDLKPVAFDEINSTANKLLEKRLIPDIIVHSAALRTSKTAEEVQGQDRPRIQRAIR